MMKITGLSHLFKWENLPTQKILFCPTVQTMRMLQMTTVHERNIVSQAAGW